MTRTGSIDTVPDVEEMTPDEGAAMLRGEVADKLGISLNEFFERLDAGDYDQSDDDVIHRLIMLAPFAR